MSRDADAKADPKTVRFYDKRTVERNIKKGLVSRKDYEKHLKALDDVADKGVYGAPVDDVDDIDTRIDEAEDELTGADEELAAEPASAEAAPEAEDEADDEPEDDADDVSDDVSGGEPPESNSHGM